MKYKVTFSYPVIVNYTVDAINRGQAITDASKKHKRVYLSNLNLKEVRTLALSATLVNPKSSGGRPPPGKSLFQKLLEQKGG